MALKIEDISQYLGQVIHDVYGRKLGVLVAIYSDVDGTVTSIDVAKNDESYENIPADRIECCSEGIKIKPEWLVKAKKLERKLNVVKRRMKALEDLYGRGQIPEHAYRELKERLSKELERCKKEANELREELRKRTYDLENFVIKIEKAMTYVMVGFTADEVPQKGFDTAMNYLRFAKQCALEEKKDIEQHADLITKLLDEINAVIEGSETGSSIVTNIGEPLTVKVLGGE